MEANTQAPKEWERNILRGGGLLHSGDHDHLHLALT